MKKINKINKINKTGKNTNQTNKTDEINKHDAQTNKPSKIKGKQKTKLMRQTELAIFSPKRIFPISCLGKKRHNTIEY